MLANATPLGAYLNEEELLKLARACSILRFRKGKPLRESPFYLLIEGVVSVVAVESGLELCSRTSFFTRHAGQDGVTVMETSLVGKESGKVLVVSSEYKLDDFYDMCSSQGREGYAMVVSTNLSHLLRNVDFVKESHLSGAELLKLAEMCSYLAVPERADVFKQGDLANAFYIILKGTAEVCIYAACSHDRTHMNAKVQLTARSCRLCNAGEHQ